jgi:hypothetical protein
MQFIAKCIGTYSAWKIINFAMNIGCNLVSSNLYFVYASKSGFFILFDKSLRYEIMISIKYFADANHSNMLGEFSQNYGE